MSTLAEITDALVAQLVADVDETTGTWSPCWRRFTSLPSNALTGNPYQGGNTIALWAAQVGHGYERPLWATYRQWAELGGQVTKGERSTRCVKWVVKETDDPKKPKLLPSVFHLFNVAQQQGWEPPVVEPLVHDDVVAAALARLRAVPYTSIVGEPAYAPGADVVMMPPDEAFTSSEALCAILAHELAHWTGHPSRLHRDMSGRFGSDAYAGEELVAEISSCITAATLGVDPGPLRQDHAIYLQHWLRVLKADSSLLFTAAAAAQKATEHLLAYSATAFDTVSPPTLEPSLV